MASMTEKRFHTPREAETAFYAAFIKRDVDAMMAVWAESGDISCVHPLGQIVTGRTAVRDSWESIFRNSPDMQFMITERSRTQNGEIAVHIVEEHIRTKSEPPTAPMQVTNIYRLTEGGWRMILHHASPASPPAKTESKTLH